MVGDEHLHILCSSLGIDVEGNVLDTISELMNFSLQCLGAIRLLFESLEKDRKMSAILSVDGINKSQIVGQGYWGMKSSFSNAVKRYLERIVLSEEPHNLDPARHIIESFPNSAKIGSKEWLAAHWAILGDPCIHSFSSQNNYRAVSGFDSRVFAIEALGNIMPDCFKEVDKEGRSVLHIAARLDSVDLFEITLQSCEKYNGKTIQDANLNGALPLHNAARFCNCPAVYERVRNEYPEAITMVNLDDMLPLHWAAVKNRNVTIVRDLMQRYPEGIISANHEGYLPLHCAGQNNCLDVVQLIYDAYPIAVSIPDSEGGLPLHHACCFKGNAEVAKFICEAYPDALTSPQQGGITPIHLAASQNDSVELLRYILDKYPEATTLQDKEGWLPIDCLLDRINSRVTNPLLDCLHLLARANPSLVSGKVVLEESLISRILLNANPSPNVVMYRNLNWLARRNGVWILINLSNDEHEYNYDFATDHLRKYYAIQYLSNQPGSKHSWEDFVSRSVEYEVTRMKLLRKLCRHFMGNIHRGVPSGVLQKIIKML